MIRTGGLPCGLFGDQRGADGTGALPSILEPCEGRAAPFGAHDASPGGWKRLHETPPEWHPSRKTHCYGVRHSVPSNVPTRRSIGSADLPMSILAQRTYLSRSQRTTSGFTLLEVVVSILLLMIGIAGISRLTVGVTRAGTMQRETELATEGARAKLERIKAEAFSQAFRTSNATGADDPSGAGTAPGAYFEVAGLRPAPDDPDGMPGEVIFPVPPDQPGQLCESVNDPKLAMPRDLNGDGIVDSLNHATDYKLLPVRVRVRWQSIDGTIGLVELKTNLANY